MLKVSLCSSIASIVASRELLHNHQLKKKKGRGKEKKSKFHMALPLKMCLDSIHFFSALFLSFSLASLSSSALKTKAALGHVAANSFLGFFFFSANLKRTCKWVFRSSALCFPSSELSCCPHSTADLPLTSSKSLKLQTWALPVSQLGTRNKMCQKERWGN